jgi:HSP20 family protein
VRHDEVFRQFDRSYGARAHGRFEPNADVWIDEDGERMVVRVELAGCDGTGLRVALDDRYLYIVGSRGALGESATASFLRKEIILGEFFKKIPLPVPVDFEASSATIRDGILTITLPLAALDRMPMVTTEIRMTVTRTLA